MAEERSASPSPAEIRKKRERYKQFMKQRGKGKSTEANDKNASEPPLEATIISESQRKKPTPDEKKTPNPDVSSMQDRLKNRRRSHREHQGGMRDKMVKRLGDKLHRLSLPPKALSDDPTEVEDFEVTVEQADSMRSREDEANDLSESIVQDISACERTNNDDEVVDAVVHQFVEARDSPLEDEDNSTIHDSAYEDDNVKPDDLPSEEETSGDFHNSITPVILSAGQSTKTEKPFDERSNSSTVDLIGVREAAAKIVQTKLQSPTSQAQPMLKDENNAPEATNAWLTFESVTESIDKAANLEAESDVATQPDGLENMTSKSNDSFEPASCNAQNSSIAISETRLSPTASPSVADTHEEMPGMRVNHDGSLESTAVSAASSCVTGEDILFMGDVASSVEDADTSEVTEKGGHSWDTRSIMEHLPNGVISIDTTWDASRMPFAAEAVRPNDDDKAIDMFDTFCWAQTDTEFSQVTEVVSNRQSDLARLMRASLETATDEAALDSSPQPCTSSAEDNAELSTDENDKVDPGLERSEATQKDWACLRQTKAEESEGLAHHLAGAAGTLKEEEALLGEVDVRSDLEAPLVDEISQARLEDMRKQRVVQYTETPDLDDYISSSDGDDDSEHSSDGEEEEGAIQYVAHSVDFDSEENDIKDARPMDDPSLQDISGESVAVFQAANEAAMDAQGCCDEKLIDRQGRAVSSEQTGSELKVETNRINTIPLIPPPPEEKLRKWEEHKARPLKLLKTTSFKASNTPRPPPTPENVTGRNLNIFTQTQRNDAASPSLIPSEQQPDEKLDVSEDVEVQARRKEASEFSPISYKDGDSRIVLSSPKIAEKVAVASSVAAEILEESIYAVKSSETIRADAEFGETHEGSNATSLMFCGGNATLKDSFFDFAGDSFGPCSPTTMKKARSVLPHEPDEVERSRSGVELIGGAFSSWKNGSLVDDVNEWDEPNLVVAENQTSVDQIATASFATSGYHEVPISVRDQVLPNHLESVEKSLTEDVESTVALSEQFLLSWVRSLLRPYDCEEKKSNSAESELRALLGDDRIFDRVCAIVSTKVNAANSLRSDENSETAAAVNMRQVVPFAISNSTRRPEVLAANFVSFLQRIGKLTGVPSPFKDENPFVLLIVGESLSGQVPAKRASTKSMQELVFSNEDSDEVVIARFFFAVAQEVDSRAREIGVTTQENVHVVSRNSSSDEYSKPRVWKYLSAPQGTPSPFETTTWVLPSVVLIILGFLGDPVAVCRMKMTNRFCNRIISENEHVVMRDAVRSGGMSMNVRPAFWMWVTIEKCGHKAEVVDKHTDQAHPLATEFANLARKGLEGKWHGVIERDVARAFGNMPPHKTRARLKADSIVRALVTFGRGRLIKRGVKGGGEAPPTPTLMLSSEDKARQKRRESTAPPPWEIGDDQSECSQDPTDTVSDWGGVTPVASWTSSVGEDTEGTSRRQVTQRGESSTIHDGQYDGIADQGSSTKSRESVEDLALNGNAISDDMKIGLQNQLSLILHALAARHDDVGYCQGMDYVVAHLLRVLQDTVKWRAVTGSLPTAIGVHKDFDNLPGDDSVMIEALITERLVVEEAVFRVMDCFFTSYNLRHMYWPELRQLKICCRVFERLIQHKLPVLADHFEHHELNVGLFALGWFQTLFLYLPSMPTATVCHMWDIWLVERSFKIFFRVGTAILFLSQPILLNHDLEGMMTYLNTFPDATLLKSDILIACALQIKVTNRMLMELEMKVTGND
jgi:hypothetical protein